MEMKQQFFKHTSVNRTFFIMVLIAALLTGLFAPAMVRHSGAASPFIILSSYRSSLKIGQEMVLSAVTSDLSYPSFTGLLHRFRQCIWSDHCQKSRHLQDQSEIR